MDISTKDGMAKAVAWTSAQINCIKDGGQWFIPRSLTLIEIHHKTKTAVFTGLFPEPDIKKVFRAMGWTVMDVEQTN